MHCRSVFVIHGSETSLKIAEWGCARRFFKRRVGVGHGTVLDYFQNLREVFIIGEVCHDPGFIQTRVFLFIVVMNYQGVC